ncbi:RagB/SusD family nutrient uptake outer membrane protein [Sphingobacterium tabacisoli]|uniref:RagB/SusD family nutrient uptake outer membrane protein n=1 Tax=Sphingobacterium tabacisoli TaxID=2044855 RepID=A0ABW5L6F0_9SPHI|nr:RagB/SusD family nutrient uptake outer membrane protein [Sphingobacterium tabacisoli]
MKTTIYIILLKIALLLSFASCNNYLDVAPKSTLREDEIFSSQTGFEQALAAVYANLASKALYGDNLTMGFVSALGQNYNTTSSNNPLYGMAQYNYTSDIYRNISIDIWRSAYKVIAALNNIILHTETNKAVLNDNVYNRVRGEALALRAFIHFDLVRLFGKSMILGADEASIPYRITFDQFGRSPHTTREVLEKALADLKEGQNLLKVSDPVLQNSVNRQIKMNYYATKALEARILLYAGRNTDAYSVAKQLVESGIYPLLPASELTKADNQKNRLLKGELIFTLRNKNLNDWVNQYFRFSGNSVFSLTRSTADINSIYESNPTDKRLSNWFQDDQSSKFPSKYWQTYSQISGSNDSTRLDQMVPAIRISEIRLILAETAPDPLEGLAQLAAIRAARDVSGALQITNVTRSYLMAEIQKEYEKDLYGEGQLFFFHKRLNSKNIKFYSQTVNPTLYTLPIPDSELEYNPTY